MNHKYSNYRQNSNNNYKKTNNNTNYYKPTVSYQDKHNKSDTTIDDDININIKNIVLDYLYNKIELS